MQSIRKKTENWKSRERETWELHASVLWAFIYLFLYISISRLFGQRPSDGAAVFPIPVFFAVCLHQSLTCLLIPDEENIKKSFGPILPFSFPPAIFCLSFDAGIWYKTQIQKTKKILDSEKYKTWMQNKWKIVDSGLTWWTKHALPNFPEQDRRSWGGRLWHCALKAIILYFDYQFDGFFFR